MFLAGGQRRTVCELCVPRAAAEGWLREADNHSSSVRPTRSRRAGSLLGRLRQLREPAHSPLRRESQAIGRLDDAEEEVELPGETLYDPLDGEAGRQGIYEQEIYIGSVQAGDPHVAGWSPEDDFPSTGDAGVEDAPTARSRPVRAGEPVREAFTTGELKVARALEVFNAGEQPRRVAGVARSLGAPTVTVRPLESSGSTVAIVVAWELCWYRYEVDLGDEAAGSQLVSQGMELDELPAEDRLANAAADERGELSPLPV